MAERERRVVSTVGRIPLWVRWSLAAVFIGAFVVWLVWCAPTLFVPTPPRAELRSIDAARRVELQNNVRTTLLQGLGGLAVLGGAFFAYQQLQTNRRQLQHNVESSRQQHDLDREGQVTERFTRAIDQLGHGSQDVRLGGIYALERTAKDSPTDRLTITEVLTSFVRGHAPWPLTRPDSPPEATTDVKAAMTVLGRRTVSEEDPPLILGSVDLRGVDLFRANLQRADLNGANLQGARLNDADLSGANLDRADLAKMVFLRTNLGGASLTAANLEKAQFLEGTNLTSARLVDANLKEAYFGASINLRGASLTRANLLRADLTGARLKGVSLGGADVRGAQLYGAQLEEADLRNAKADANTRLPEGFDWKAAGVLKEE